MEATLPYDYGTFLHMVKKCEYLCGPHCKAAKAWHHVAKHTKHNEPLYKEMAKERPTFYISILDGLHRRFQNFLHSCASGAFEDLKINQNQFNAVTQKLTTMTTMIANQFGSPNPNVRNRNKINKINNLQHDQNHQVIHPPSVAKQQTQTEEKTSPTWTLTAGCRSRPTYYLAKCFITSIAKKSKTSSTLMAQRSVITSIIVVVVGRTAISRPAMGKSCPRMRSWRWPHRKTP